MQCTTDDKHVNRGAKNKINVLVFPAGEIEVHEALSHNVNINVYGCSSADRHGGYVYRNYRAGLPNISESGFIEAFNALILEWQIKYVFPMHDTVALFMAKHQPEIKAKVIVASYETAEICRDKRKTYDLFADCDFCPDQYHGFEHLPVFIKPRDSQGGKGSKLVCSSDEIPQDIAVDDYTFNEYLPGKELTVDCLTDAQGKLRACLPRTRERLFAGICAAGRTLKADDEIRKIVETINGRLKFFGLWYLQLKQAKSGKYKLMEISTRCAGTMCLSRARGVNLPLLSVYIAEGKNVSVFENPYTVRIDRVLISRYKTNYEYNCVYIDYDDTIIEGNDVCLPVIKYLYQCKNKGINTVLLTRHEQDHDDTVEESLKSHCIASSLFSRIEKIGIDAKKADFIEGKSIFIDNSYAERKLVHDLKGIPVFDVEGIEVLEDWRC